MTTPVERTKAVVDTRDFLEMLSTAEEVSIRGLVQSLANCLLRHFPSNLDLDVTASAVPTIWATPSAPGRMEVRAAHGRILPFRGRLAQRDVTALRKTRDPDDEG